MRLAYSAVVPTQSRATATRQRIISTAVELFVDHGYGDTSLSEIIAKADITGGAFYYHFDSKEHLAKAIIDEGWPKAVQVLDRYLSTPVPGLESVIVMSFSLSDMMKHDKAVWLSNHLNQAFGQLSEDGRKSFQDHATVFISELAKAMQSTPMRDGITHDQAASMVWIMLHGCHLLSDAMIDDVLVRLASSWAVLLNGILPADSLAYFHQFLRRTAGEYGITAQD